MTEKMIKKQKIEPIFKGQVNCACKQHCAERIDILRQREIFDTYCKCECWTDKVMFIRGICTRIKQEPKRENLNPQVHRKKRQTKCSYHFLDTHGKSQEVCLPFVLNVLQTNRSKLFRASCVALNPSATDHRGKMPVRISNPKDIAFIKQFIGQYAHYKSRAQQHNKSVRFLHPSLNSKTMYNQYKQECMFKQMKPKSFALFRKILKNDFMLKFVVRYRAHCADCKKFKKMLKHKILSISSADGWRNKLETHLNAVRRIKDEYISIIELAQDPMENVEVFTFSYDTPTGLPIIKTAAFHQTFMERPLWVHNFCITDELCGKCHMHMWSEMVASNGPTEAGSCIYRHLLQLMPKSTKKLILNCDPSHGKYRNIELSLMIMNFFNVWCHPDLESIEQRFFHSGHSYNSCERSFDMISRAKKKVENLTLPDDFMETVRYAKESEPKFNVVEMKIYDFLSVEPLEKLIIDKKISADGKKIKWSAYKSITHKKNEPFVLHVTEYDETSSKITLKTKPNTIVFGTKLPLLYPSGRLISELKYKDLQKFINHIPTQFQTFYKNIPRLSNEIDNDHALCNEWSSDEE